MIKDHLIAVRVPPGDRWVLVDDMIDSMNDVTRTVFWKTVGDLGFYETVKKTSETLTNDIALARSSVAIHKSLTLVMNAYAVTNKHTPKVYVVDPKQSTLYAFTQDEIYNRLNIKEEQLTKSTTQTQSDLKLDLYGEQ